METLSQEVESLPSLGVCKSRLGLTGILHDRGQQTLSDSNIQALQEQAVSDACSYLVLFYPFKNVKGHLGWCGSMD